MFDLSEKYFRYDEPRTLSVNIGQNNGNRGNLISFVTTISKDICFNTYVLLFSLKNALKTNVKY